MVQKKLIVNIDRRFLAESKSGSHLLATTLSLLTAFSRVTKKETPTNILTIEI